MRRHRIHSFFIFVFLLAALPVTPAVASTQVASDSDVQINGGAYNALMPPTSGGSVGNATGGTTNHAPTFSGGNVGIGTTSPATGLKVDISRSAKAAGTGSEACTASDLGKMRYNSTGQYMEICTGP